MGICISCLSVIEKQISGYMYFLSECMVGICISCLSVIEKQIRWVYVFLVLV